MTQAAAHSHSEVLRKQWQAVLESLADDVEEWSRGQSWTVKRETVELDQDSWGPYEAPLLHVRKGRRGLTIEPVARRIVGGDGLVNIRGKLPFKKLLLVRKRGAWKIYTEDRIAWPEAWGESAFLKIAEALTAP